MLRIALVLAAMMLAGPAAATEAGWALLRDGGHVVLLAHAYATGSTDPANVDVTKCSTQRNLSERGKQQARKMGALFAARAADIDAILSSRFCRCLDTARIAFGRDAEPFEALDLPAADEAAAEAQRAAVIETIAGFSGSGNLVLVTHPETIRALTGAGAREGEAVIVRTEGEGLHVLGRIVFN
ncbi:MAG: histidine phosphatase family protein [Rhizobiaceae bacterium]|nr:histidine phosphatase family protein [Rhizobiaceae bacterium]